MRAEQTEVALWNGLSLEEHLRGREPKAQGLEGRDRVTEGRDRV